MVRILSLMLMLAMAFAAGASATTIGLQYDIEDAAAQVTPAHGGLG
jgi:hypothetical protein